MLKLNKKYTNKIFSPKKAISKKVLVKDQKKNFIKTNIDSIDLMLFKDSSAEGQVDRFRNKIGRIAHPVGNAAIFTDLVLKMLDSPLEYGTLGYGFTIFFLQSGLDKMFHNIAMRKASVIVRKLKNLGITDESDLRFAVDYYLKKNGGLVYSNLVRKFAPNQIQKVAIGEKPPQIKGLMTWLQSKFTLGSYYNKPQMCKANKNLKKLFKNIINSVRRVQFGAPN